MEQQSRTSSFLNTLPAEIRLQIYEHAIGNRLIHVAHSSSGMGAVYTVCTAPQHSEDEAYNLTRTWTEPESLPEWEHVYYSSDNKTWLKEYSVRHSRCVNLLDSFRSWRYQPALYKVNEGYAVEDEALESGLPLYQRRCKANMCSGSGQWRNKCEHYRDLELRFGQACPDSFHKLHPDSFLEMSNLLVSCRQIYDEARLIPFTSNDFVLHVDTAKYLKDVFSTRFLRPWQQHAIQHISIQGTAQSGFDMRLIAQALKLLPGVQRLSISTNCPPGVDLAEFLVEDAINHNIELPLVPRANIILGHDNTTAWRSRVERRRQALRVERLLTKGTPEDEQSCLPDSDDQDDHDDDREPDLEQQLEDLRIPKLPYPREPIFMAHCKYNSPLGAGN